MNSLLLLLLGAVVLVFGYRFYAKLLAAEVYRLENNYSIAGAVRADGAKPMEGHPHLIFGHYFASVGAVATLLGVILAATWGWIPAFLGLIVGAALVGGVYGMGALWLGLQSAAQSPGAAIPVAATEVLGAPARRIFLLLIFLLLLGANAVFAVLAAQLLVAYPSAVLPFWLQIPVALGLGLFLHRRPAFAIIPASAIALLLLILLTWLAGKIPFALAGVLTGQVWDMPIFALDGGALWLLLLFLYLFYTAHLPVWKLARPRGWLTSLQTGLLLLIALGGMLFLHPTVVAPEFHRGHDLTIALPWLFVVLGSGSLAGVYVLAAGTLAVQQLPPASGSRHLGYGGTLADAALGLTALIVAVAAFDNPAAWRQHYDLPLVPVQLLELYVQGVAHFARPFGIDREFIHSFAAVILATLATTGLEAGVRLQRTLVQTMQSDAAAHPRTQALAWIAGVILALTMYAYADGVQGWSWLGLANLVAAGLVLAVIAAILRQRQRPPASLALVLAPALALLLLGDWALLTQLLQAWSQSSYTGFIVGLLLLGAQTWVLVSVARMFRPQPPVAPQLDTGA